MVILCVQNVLIIHSLIIIFVLAIQIHLAKIQNGVLSVMIYIKEIQDVMKQKDVITFQQMIN